MYIELWWSIYNKIKILENELMGEPSLLGQNIDFSIIVLIDDNAISEYSLTIL